MGGSNPLDPALLLVHGVVSKLEVLLIRVIHIVRCNMHLIYIVLTHTTHSHTQ